MTTRLVCCTYCLPAEWVAYTKENKEKKKKEEEKAPFRSPLYFVMVKPVVTLVNSGPNIDDMNCNSDVKHYSRHDSVLTVLVDVTSKYSNTDLLRSS